MYPKPPAPPETVVSLGLFQWRNGVAKVLFLCFWAFFLHVLFRRHPEPFPGWAYGFGLTAVAAFLAAPYALLVHSILVDLVNAFRTQTYESAFKAFEESRPFDELRADQDGVLQPYRRPLYDPRMGLEPTQKK